MSYYNSINFRARESAAYSDVQEDMQVQKNNNKAVIALCAGAVAGAGAGAAIGTARNPYIRNDIPTDSFTKRTIEAAVKKLSEEDRKVAKQLKEILNQISKVSTPDELKTLINGNMEGAKEILSNPADFLNNINESNLKATKDSIKDTISSKNNMMLQDWKNKIHRYWNSEKKAFENTSGFESNVYDAIVDAKKGMKFKQALKFGAIGAAACGVLGIILQQVLSHKKEV